ncbi:MAG: copper resistance D family protein, partial [Acidimicrobiales bacterium]
LFAVANDVVHLAAAGAWLGGVVAIWRVLAARNPDRPAGVAHEALRTFSPLAGTGLAVVFVTGWIAIGDQVRSIDALIGTTYGWVLITKLLLMAAIVALALGTRRALRGVSTTGAGGRLIGPEAVGGVLLFAAVAVLTSITPANGVEWRPAAVAVSRQLAIVQDDIQLGVTVTPNVPGQNLLLVDAVSTRRPEPAPVDRVLARVRPLDIEVAASTVELEPTDRRGEYELPTTAFSVAGAYELEVVVRRAGLPDVVGDFGWTVASPAGARTETISDAELAPFTSTAGAVGAVAVGMGAVWLVLLGVVRDRRVRSVETFLAVSDSSRTPTEADR